MTAPDIRNQADFANKNRTRDRPRGRGAAAGEVRPAHCVPARRRYNGRMNTAAQTGAAGPPPDTDAPFLAGEDLAGRLRRVFAEHGFDEAGIAGRLGGVDVNRLAPRSRPRLLAMTAAGTPLDILIRLFVLSGDVAGGDAARALAPVGLAGLVRAGLLRGGADGVTSLVRIRPFAGRLLAYDPSDCLLREDHVLGPGHASRELHNATVRIPFRRALDLGTGCGVQALSCAAHCETVVGTDVNPRAVAIARFNAELNGLPRVEVRAGNLFEPVAMETFDLIVMNMPYAISPGVKFLFRDAGGDGDAFLQQVIREVPGHLTEGGYCFLAAQWAQTEGEPWRERVWRWFKDSPLDVWILRQTVQLASAYAEGWIAETEEPGDAARWHAWMDYLRARRIEAVHGGLLCLRRRAAGAGWFSISDDAGALRPGAGDDILLGFGMRDFLARHKDDAELLGHCYRVAPALRVERTTEPSETGWRTTEVVLRNAGGLTFVRRIDENTFEILRRLDGRRTLDQVIDGYATEARIDWAVLTDHVVATIRPLLEHGFIRPV